MCAIRRSLNGQDGHGMRFVKCMQTRLPYMNEHTNYNGGDKSKMFYEGHIGINGDYKKTIIGTDGAKFNTIGTYDVVGEAGITLGRLRDTRWDNGAETKFDVSVFGGTKCGAKMNLSGKTAVGGDAYTRFNLTGGLHGEYAHSLKNSQIIESLPVGFEGVNPQLSSMKAGATVGCSVDATIQRLSVSAEAGPEFQWNRATIGDQSFEYKNGVINAKLGVEYTPPMPENSKMGLSIGAYAGLEAPFNITKDSHDSIQVTGITDTTNITPAFGITLKGVF